MSCRVYPTLQFRHTTIVVSIIQMIRTNCMTTLKVKGLEFKVKKTWVVTSINIISAKRV